MVAKVYADRPSPEAESEGDPSIDASVETEVQSIALWFEALPVEWQRYFDHEARSGRRAYGQA